jgi:hypothetical protein
MTYSKTHKSPPTGSKENSAEIDQAALTEALAATNGPPAPNHSQDADRHDKLSHKRLAKDRNFFEHSDAKE